MAAVHRPCCFGGVLVRGQLFEGDIVTTTLKQAKDWLRLRAKRGARCPCCKQYVKVYKRPLHSSMALVLVLLVRNFEAMATPLLDDGFVHVPTFINKLGLKAGVAAAVRGDWAKLVHWGLIENRPKDVDDISKKDSGYWRPTSKGIDYAHGRCTVNSHVYLYDNILLNWEDQTIARLTIFDALGEKFDYSRLMSAPIHVQVPL